MQLTKSCRDIRLRQVQLRQNLSCTRC